MQGLQLICLYRVIAFLKYPYLALSCNKKELATEGRPRTSRSISHGITRKRHGKDTEKTRKRHGKDTHTSFRLNKRGQVSFSALNIICYWFRLAAEKETWPLLFFRSRSISHGLTRNYTEGKCAGRRKTGPPHTQRWRRREGRKIKGEASFLDLSSLAYFASSRWVFLKEAKHFYREDAKTAKRQKGRSKKHLPRNYTEKTLKRHTHLSEPDALATVALILSSVISLP